MPSCQDLSDAERGLTISVVEDLGIKESKGYLELEKN